MQTGGDSARTLINRISAKVPRKTNDEIKQMCIELIERHGIHPNMPVFGTGKEPLLHALARINRLSGMAKLHRTTGADVELANAAGETPLAIALMGKLPIESEETVESIVKLVGGQLNALPTVRAIATHCVRQDDVNSIMTLTNAGMKIDPKQVPLMHLFALHCQNVYTGMYLLDKLGQDPLERDAQGHTILELPAEIGTVDLRSQIQDAIGNSPEHDLAVLMGFHKRLGASSLLQSISVELFRDFVLPHAVRQLNISMVRETRLKALTANEGVKIKSVLEFDYVHMGSGDITLADFRREHFLNVTPGLLSNLPREIQRSKTASRDMLTDRLTEKGFLFDKPYTAKYALRARASLKMYR